MLQPAAFRTEHDSLGEVAVPADAYYGAQTARAVANFPISGVPISHYPSLIRALAMVKQAAALANRDLGKLSAAKCDAIGRAAQEVIDGELHQHFPVDVFQGGAGTSTNMNINEVLSHRGLELMGLGREDVAALHPNDDVNMSQSTNDTYPTSVRVAVLLSGVLSPGGYLLVGATELPTAPIRPGVTPIRVDARRANAHTVDRAHGARRQRRDRRLDCNSGEPKTISVG